MSVIEAQNVSIRYVTGDLKNIGLKEYLMLKAKGTYQIQEFWADKDVSFVLEKGDMLGIIGTNGAGKSTLLKAISGIMRPTKGKMKVHGTIAALLELASGFDGDLTVKENAYLRGAMLGYTRQFMDEQYDAIIDFAELKEFENRPFKQLSSGMKSRLAFSIACLVNPDILILDEVLSVGDGAFKEKSGNKMKEILGSGVTGILVSHSLSQIREMCTKILWLDHGSQIGFSDNVEIYCNAYEEFLHGAKLPSNEEELLALGRRPIERKAEAERKKKEEFERKLRLKEEAERKKKEEAERKLKLQAEAAAKKALAEEERRQKELNKRAEEDQKLFSLKALCSDPNNGSFASGVISEYLRYSNTARIDIKNNGSEDNKVVIEEISDAKASINFPRWFAGNGHGCVIESEVDHLSLTCRCIGDGTLKIWLRGKDVRYNASVKIPVWIKYTGLTINGETILNQAVECWHNSPYSFSTKVADGDALKIVITKVKSCNISL